MVFTDGVTNSDTSTQNVAGGGVGELSKILQHQQSSSSGSSPILDPVPGTSRVIPQQNGPMLDRNNSSTATTTTTTSVFKSPNTVCPMDGKLPVHVSNIGSENVAEYPFESMIRARVIHRREITQGMNPNATTTTSTTASSTPTTQTFVQPPPPPPYPATATTITPANSGSVKGTVPIGSPTIGSNNIAISSPLLVNLLQNEGAGPSNNGMAKQQSPQDRVNSSNVSSSGGNKCIVQTNNKNLMSKSTIVTSQQQQQQQQVAGTQQEKQAIVINNNLLSNKSPNSNNTELSSSVGAATASPTNTPLIQQQQQAPLSSLGVAQSSPVPLPTTTPNAVHQMRPQMSLQMQQQQQQRPQHSVYFARLSSNQQHVKYVGHNASLRQQLPMTQPPQQIPNASYPNNNVQGASENVRWKQNAVQIQDPECQEFDRYQKQYNHSQQQQENTQVIGAGIDLPPSYGQHHHQIQQQQPTNNRASSQQQQHSDPLGLGNLAADLADLSKNDLDSLLPSLHPNDLDSALFAFDTKVSSLDYSLLDIDLISSLETTNAASATTSSATNSSSSGNSSLSQLQQQQQLTNGPIVENNHSTSTTPQVQLKQNKVESQRFLINPLTGDMEITQMEDTSEQDVNNIALVGADFQDTYKCEEDDDFDDDESSRGTNFSAKFPTSDMSDTEKSNQSGEHMLQMHMSTMKGTKKCGRAKKEKIVNADGSVVKIVKEKTQKTRVNKVKKAVITPVPSPTSGANVELKLRLKLDTSNQATSALKKPIASKPTAMVAQQYNFNASIAQQFMQQSQVTTTGSGSGNTTVTSNAMGNFTGEQSSSSPTTEEPRVPPLHISIKNKSVVIKNASVAHNKKEKKRFLSVSIIFIFFLFIMI